MRQATAEKIAKGDQGALADTKQKHQAAADQLKKALEGQAKAATLTSDANTLQRFQTAVETAQAEEARLAAWVKPATEPRIAATPLPKQLDNQQKLEKIAIPSLRKRRRTALWSWNPRLKKLSDKRPKDDKKSSTKRASSPPPSNSRQQNEGGFGSLPGSNRRGGRRRQSVPRTQKET